MCPYLWGLSLIVVLTGIVIWGTKLLEWFYAGLVVALLWTFVAGSISPVVDEFDKPLPLRAIGNVDGSSSHGSFFLIAGGYSSGDSHYYYYMVWDEDANGWTVGKEGVEDSVIRELPAGQEAHIVVHCEAERWRLFSHTEEPECTGLGDYAEDTIFVIPDDAITTDMEVDLPQ